MAEQSTHINYSFEDIQRYLQGNMSAAEMHLMEKAALQDPFLADAIEGYAEMPSSTAAKHLSEINAAISGGRQKSRIVSFRGSTEWIRIAALLIILAGVGVIGVYVLKSSNQEQQVAELKKENALKSPPTATDSQEIKPPDQAAKGLEELSNSSVQNQAKQNQPASATEKKSSGNGTTSSGKNAETNQAATTTISAAPSAINDDEKKEVETDAYKSVMPGLKLSKTDSLHLNSPERAKVSVTTITGKVIDENNQPVPNVVVQSADKKAIVVSDADGNFNLQRQDSFAKVSTSAIGYESKTAELKAGDANQILLRQSSPSLNEVVVTAYGTKKNNNLNNPGASPVGGWKNFNNYVQQQLNKDTTTDYDYYESDDLVELEFSVDKAGNPVHIKFLQSLDAQRNAKALEIISNGPKWISNKDRKVRIRISF